jgi:hypothetical protein
LLNFLLSLSDSEDDTPAQGGSDLSLSIEETKLVNNSNFSTSHEIEF